MEASSTSSPLSSLILVPYVCLSVLRDVFPQGLPDEYAFVTTFRFRKTSRKEDWYIWQVIDQYGIPQVWVVLPVSGASAVSCSQEVVLTTVVLARCSVLGLDRSLGVQCTEPQRTCRPSSSSLCPLRLSA